MQLSMLNFLYSRNMLSKNEYENFDRVMEQYKQYVLDVEVTLIRMLN